MIKKTTKKHLIALGASVLCTAASAQSSVTLFGVVDAGIGHVSSTGSKGATGVITGGNSTSRLGFRGTEDLGAGLKASFWLEGELQSDTGTPNGLTFQRRSTLSLSGHFGELRLGRDFAPSYLNMIAFDVYSQRGMGLVEYYGYGTSAAQGGGFTSGGAGFNYLRASNSIGYFLPSDLGGVYGTVQYAFGERDSGTPTSATNSSKQGNSFGARIGYASGPLDVSAAYTRFADVSRAATYVDDYTVANAALSWNFGVLKASALAQQERMDGHGALPAFQFNTYALGISAPIGAGVLRASLSKYDNKTAVAQNAGATKFGVGYVYSLSKRTALYGDVARVNNRNAGTFQVGGYGGSIGGVVAPTAGGNSTGFAVGMRHSF